MRRDANRHDDSGGRHRERAADSDRRRALELADLKIVVLTKRSDPRFGETIYRLLNVVRAEPDASLFLVLSDYTVSDARSTFSIAKPRPQEQ